jgi:hypothetical protein
MAAVKAVTTRLAMVYPWALSQLSSGSGFRKLFEAIAASGFSSHSTHKDRPGETGKPQAAHVANFVAAFAALC